jgi:hypothetical protein
VYGARCGSRGSGSIPEGMVPRVAFAPTHCKPFDLLIPEQWVFGYTLIFTEFGKL